MTIPVLPPIARQIFARAQKVAVAVKDAVQPAPALERADRRAICDACPHKFTTAGLERCGKCGCSLTGKSFLQRAHCPDNPPRW
jgi:hypothetical protein